jgi:hypothetical protein
MGVDGALLHQQSVFQGVFPERHTPLGQWISTPNIIHQNVQPSVLLFSNPIKEHMDFFLHRVIHPHRDSHASPGVDHFSGFFDRFRAPHGRKVSSDTSTGDIDSRSCFAQRDGNAPAGTAGSTRHYGYFSFKQFQCGPS